MAATPKPMRTKQKKISSEMREHAKESIPHKGIRKEVTKKEVNEAKKMPGGKKLAKAVKSFHGGDYEGMMKAKRAKKK